MRSRVWIPLSSTLCIELKNLSSKWIPYLLSIYLPTYLPTYLSIYTYTQYLYTYIQTQVVPWNKILSPYLKENARHAYQTTQHCCRQMIKTTTFKINQNKRAIYHNVNCKSNYTIYLIGCTKCKLQYVGKAEAELNAIPADRHFAKRDHEFNTDAKFTIVQNAKLSKESITELLKMRENFWIKKLETLRPKGLNHELNWQIPSYVFFSSTWFHS